MKLNFFRHYYFFFIFSLIVLLAGGFSLLKWGLRSSVDFAGGSLLKIQIISVYQSMLTSDDIQQTIGDSFELSSIQSTSNNGWILRGKEINNEVKTQVISLLSEKYGTVVEQQFHTVGPILGKELLIKTIIGIIIVSIGIMLYVMRQFSELKYGVSAILAMLHDSAILIGMFSIFGHFFHAEVDVLFVTALLTTLSFSIHDTIVVYDRIRELRKKHFKTEVKELANIAVLQTLSRSINNSLTIIFMLIVLVLLGGETLRWFSIALLVGAITGTYSSTFTAIPLVLLWDDLIKKFNVKKLKVNKK